MQVGPSAQMAGYAKPSCWNECWLPIPIRHGCVCLQLSGCAVSRCSCFVGPSGKRRCDPRQCDCAVLSRHVLEGTRWQSVAADGGSSC